MTSNHCSLRALSYAFLTQLIANAGVIRVGSVLSLNVEEFDMVMKVNARGEFLCLKHGAAQMVKQGRGGRIVCEST